MGTTYAVTVITDAPDGDPGGLGISIAAALDDVDAKMSTYDAGSEVSRFNRLRRTDWFPLSPDTFRVLQEAIAVGRLTEGALDVTVGPLVDAWGFGPPGPVVHPPTMAEIDSLLEDVGSHHLELDEAGTRVRKRRPQVTLDLSAVAKGYAVDRVAETLDRVGVHAYLVEVGGEVRTRGRRADGERWRVGIERPSPGPPVLQRVVELDDACLATSGDYRNYMELDGTRYSHTIDPRTGAPVTHGLASASVVETTCLRADALATALEVLGPDEGRRLAVERGWAVLLIRRDEDGHFTEHVTPAFAALASSSPFDDASRLQ